MKIGAVGDNRPGRHVAVAAEELRRGFDDERRVPGSSCSRTRRTQSRSVGGTSRFDKSEGRWNRTGRLCPTERTGLRFSCSHLPVDVADQPNAFQDHVIVHELLHLRVPNHGKLFESLLTAYLPVWRTAVSVNKSRRITCSDQRKSPLTEKSAQ